MDKSFAWAQAQANSLPDLMRLTVLNLSEFTDKIGQLLTIYYDKETKEAYMCVCLSKGAPRLYWRQLKNFDQMLAESPDLVNLWLRNGEYLYDHLTNGRGKKIVNLDFIR